MSRSTIIYCIASTLLVLACNQLLFTFLAEMESEKHKEWHMTTSTIAPFLIEDNNLIQLYSLLSRNDSMSSLLIDSSGKEVLQIGSILEEDLQKNVITTDLFINSELFGKLRTKRASVFSNRWGVILASNIIAIAVLLLIYLYFKKESIKNKLREERLSIRENIFKQVSHDIRSPVMALKVLKSSIKNIDDHQNKMIDGIIDRIHSISTDLVDKKSKIGTFYPVEIIYKMLREKKLEAIYFSKKIRFNFSEFEISENTSLVGSKNEFCRILSNILNNCIEACEDELGLVDISIKSKENKAVIVISDNGCGIKSRHLNSILKRNTSFWDKPSKLSGSGLGLYYAHKKILEWGGALRIESSLGLGTSIEMELQKVSVDAGEALRPVAQNQKIYQLH